ncbi:unconventional myosin-Va isoform X2 [Homalodisca vitripennis]|uniref:unconventional myosin-Va isoform X2 n=1 Tax=Homalodisca vitripennis TaxID=197043 RepID=UPI001EEB4593|nr:unconventional myosin-Va isoform X2 [Homalodisca vitripennis]
MTTKELYTKGARIWIPHPELVWEGAEVVENYVAATLKVKTEDGKIKSIKVPKEENLPPLRNPDILIGENDLTSLSYLHEPAVLYNLQVRFCNQNAIYTYCGIVLVAINPYTELPIYDTDTIHTYRGKAMGDLDPHIFAVAEEAYTKMEREQRDQSIIVSGESGAGKTVSAKYAMRYFATVGGSTTETHVERKVLASSPIMEAIGNAKTTRNDNSSRFGKFIELQFSRTYNIIGASMRTYLLEKSRVVFQAPEERNYHILYQLCAGREEYPYLKLDDATIYRYLSQEAVIPGVDDAQCFQETISALVTLGFSERKITDIFRVLASILHLGNINITGVNDMDDSSIPEADSHLLILAELLGVDVQELRKWLCLRRIVSRREVFEKPMTLTEAMGARDALAKYIYAELFSWIVQIINRTLETSSGARHKFIGVLDIYGFETFEINSFEQFCINYANEKLQQQFNQHVFKLEQEEYLREDIEWKFIDFYDNQPCIDLIETKLGILDLLDEECRMPKGSDSSWVEKLYSTCTKWPHFSKPRFGTNAFVIKHFADRVEYEALGFLEKNRDTVVEEQVEVLRSGNNRLVRSLFRDDNKLSVSTIPAAPVPKTRVVVTSKSAPSSNTSSLSKNKKTVGSQFRSSLNALMSTLNATTPHYIRCIKPNDRKLAFEYNAPRAVQQLRACGVLETIRISAAGFPSRWPYLDFFNRYRVLCRSQDIKRDNMRSTCECILVNFIKDNDRFKFGKTKIFFRAGQVAYLERLRSERLRHCCIIMQKTIRGFLQRKRYLRVIHATRTLQRLARGFVARRRVNHIRRNLAAIRIQKCVRGWVRRVKYVRLKQVILGLQARGRGLLMRRKFMEMKYNKAALIIQKNVRAWICRKNYQQKMKKVIVAQNAVRRFLARRKLKELKKEARTVQHHIALNKGLENKIIQLQQQIGELTKENNSLKTVNNELSETRAKLEVLRGADVQLKKRLVELSEQEKKLKEVASELEKERSEKIDLVTEKETLLNEYNTKKKQWTSENLELKEQINHLNEQIQNNRINVEQSLRARLDSEKQQLLQEHEQDLDNYQKVLCEKTDLEARCDTLERELTRMKGGKVGNCSFSDSSSFLSQDDSMATLINEMPEEDFGYGSVRSASSRNTDRSSDWSAQTTPESTMNRSKAVAMSQESVPTDALSVDVGLVLKLQQKLKFVEKERHRLHRRLEEHDDLPGEHKAQDNFKLQELEMENSKLRADLMTLRNTVAESIPGKPSEELMNQFKAQELELVRLRDECVQLRSVLANQTQGLKSIATTNYTAQDIDMSLINEDGELVLAFEAQKKINRQLEDELQFVKMRSVVEREELVTELNRLRDENEKQQSLLSANLTKSPQSQNEIFLKHEIGRLSYENYELQEKHDRIAEQHRKLKKLYRDLNRRMKDAGVSDLVGTQVSTVVEQVPSNQPIVRKKERKFNGMFEFKKGDENIIVRHLIYDLKPQVAIKLLPGLPAYIIFMCVRHTDFINDEEKVRNLLTEFINSIKKLVRKRSDDIEVTVLWLSNTLRLLHNLKQYSGEKTFKEENTATQNEQSLHNFDLSEYRQVLSDMAIWIYTAVIRHMEEKLQQKAVPAILEHEAISGLSTGKRGRAASVIDTVPMPTQKTLESLLQELTGFHRTLTLHGVDHEIIVSVFRQLFYYMCASSLNNLLLRKDLCHWSKGMNIRYNLSHLEQWARDKINDVTITNELAPIIQASQLLQARKSDEDVATVCEMCNKMSVPQIVKLLNLYTPADDFEERVPLSFIRKVQQRLKEQAGNQDQSTLLMDTKYNFPVRFPFKPSSIQLEEIEIPEVLNLPMLKKV